MADIAAEISRPFRITDGRKFTLDDWDPGDRAGLRDKGKAQDVLQLGVNRLAELQDQLYAQDHYALLLIFQAMDAAGKDSAIKHVMSGINPQGCQVYSFKAPSAEELDHDFLWRTSRCLPERGRIGIFNRSYYEETLVVRVHPELLARQHLPPELVTKDIWSRRFEDINAFERHLSRNGTLILKFFLNVSKKEQKKRFLDRLDDPAKRWKFSLGDVRERGFWKQYMQAYEEMLSATSTRHAPWHIIPADNKWVTRAMISGIITHSIRSLDLRFPSISKDQESQLAAARKQLMDE